MEYYIYVYLDTTEELNSNYLGIEFKYRPIYIGKGKNNRMFEHMNSRKYKKFEHYLFYKKLNKMISNDNYPLIEKIKNFEDENECLEFEKQLIDKLGKVKENGLLYNIVDGGLGASGYRFSEESKQRMRCYAIDNKSHLNFPYLCGENHPMFGRKQTSEAIEKMVKTKIGVKQTKEHIEKRVEKLRGIPLSDEHKNKLRLSNLNKIVSEETRRKQSLAKIGYIPWNKDKIKDVIVQLSMDSEFIREWNNLKELKEAGFTVSNIINVCMNNRKSHSGFKWVYKSNFLN